MHLGFNYKKKTEPAFLSTILLTSITINE